MTTLREAAEKVLKAWDDDNSSLEGRITLANKMYDLRAALAEPEPEPVAWGMRDVHGEIFDVIHPKEHDREEGAYTIPLYTRPAP